MGRVLEAPPSDPAVARAEVADRIQAAWDTLRRMPDRERSILLSAERGAAWPGMIHTAAEHAAWAKQPMRRPPPTSREIDRMEEALDWMLFLTKQDMNFSKAVFLFCALRRKPSEAARVLGCHRETATIWRDNGLDRIVKHRTVTSMESKGLKASLMEGMNHPMRKAV